MAAKSKIGAGVRSKLKNKRKSKNRKVCNKKQKQKKIGNGMKFKNRTKKINPIPQIFRRIVKTVKKKMVAQKPKTIPQAAKFAVQEARIAIKKHNFPKKALKNGLPRVIPIPNIGGVLRLIPIFAGLTALGALMRGSAVVANADISANKAKRDYNESKRHNETMEAIALGKHDTKSGNGLYLKPHRSGFGLYLLPFPKNM